MKEKLMGDHAIPEFRSLGQITIPVDESMCGYLGIGPEEGIFIPEEFSFEYALARCIHGSLDDKKEFREMLVEWFYSGNWVKEE